MLNVYINEEKKFHEFQCRYHNQVNKKKLNKEKGPSDPINQISKKEPATSYYNIIKLDLVISSTQLSFNLPNCFNVTPEHNQNTFVTY